LHRGDGDEWGNGYWTLAWFSGVLASALPKDRFVERPTGIVRTTSSYMALADHLLVCGSLPGRRKRGSSGFDLGLPRGCILVFLVFLLVSHRLEEGSYLLLRNP
jgi:hypothetical protein